MESILYKAVISSTGLFTPPHTISNEELVESFNAYVDIWNQNNPTEPKEHSSSEFIEKASGIKSRYVMEKSGILNPHIMHPVFAERANDEPSLMAEMALNAINDALKARGIDGSEIDLVIVAASNFERAYPAIAVEVQELIGAKGFAFDMNVACASATFGIQVAANMINAGSARKAIVVNPEICSAHNEFRDRDCHFIFGDVSTATIIERKEDAPSAYFEIESTQCATVFSNNIRNNNGFLRQTREGHMEDRRDMRFMQNGRKVFKEVLPIVSDHITSHLDGLTPKRIFLHQANKTMNDFIAKKVFGRDPLPEEQPTVLDSYANTSSAGSIIAFHKFKENFEQGDKAVICAFGAGYSVGSILLTYHSQ